MGKIQQQIRFLFDQYKCIKDKGCLCFTETPELSFDSESKTLTGKFANGQEASVEIPIELCDINLPEYKYLESFGGFSGIQIVNEGINYAFSSISLSYPDATNSDTISTEYNILISFNKQTLLAEPYQGGTRLQGVYEPNVLYDLTDYIINFHNSITGRNPNFSDTLRMWVATDPYQTTPYIKDFIITKKSSLCEAVQKIALNSEGGTNLGVTTNINTVTVTSSTGNGAILPLATTATAGLQKANFYDEGTFTPNLNHVYAGSSFTYTVNEAKYYRVGNLVNFELVLTGINTVGTPDSNSQIRLNGFPFVSKNIRTIPLISMRGISTSQKDYSFVMQYNSNYALLYLGGTLRDPSYDLQSEVRGASITNGKIYLSGSYITNIYTP